MVLQYLQRFPSHTNLPSSVCLIGGCGSFVYLSVCLFIYFKAESHYVAIFRPRTYYVDKAGLELTGICLLNAGAKDVHHLAQFISVLLRLQT